MSGSGRPLFGGPLFFRAGAVTVFPPAPPLVPDPHAGSTRSAKTYPSFGEADSVAYCRATGAANGDSCLSFDAVASHKRGDRLAGVKRKASPNEKSGARPTLRMHKFKPFLITAAVVVVVLYVVFQLAPASVRKTIIGA
jgi:hypothetical protein